MVLLHLRFSCVLVHEFDNVASSRELHDIVTGYNLICKKQLGFMQLSTKPFISDTWVMTRSSFIEGFAGAYVTVMLNFDNFGVMPSYT